MDLIKEIHTGSASKSSGFLITGRCEEKSFLVVEVSFTTVDESDGDDGGDITGKSSNLRVGMSFRVRL